MKHAKFLEPIELFPDCAFIYLRRSGSKQTDSLPKQEEHTRAYAKARGLKVLAIFVDDAIPGVVEDREGMLKLKSAIRTKPGCAVITYRYNRFARDNILARDFAEMRRESLAEIHSTDFGPMDLFMEDIQGAVSAYDYRKLSELMRDGRVRALQRGEYPFQAPLGYYKDKNNRLVIDPREGPHVTEAFRLRASGASVTEVGAYLNRHGIYRDRPFKKHDQNLYHMLHDPLYTGKKTWAPPLFRWERREVSLKRREKAKTPNLPTLATE